MRIFVLSMLSFSFITLSAQTKEDSVKATINTMFTAMKNADTALLRSVFADSAILQTIARTKNGVVVVKNEPLKDFIDFLAKEKVGAADERISFETVKVDGALAMAWTPYKFYYNGNFSHCGVNSFQLVKLNGEWKIQYIIDTRRRQGCE